MACTNHSKKSVALSAVYDALAWRHVLEMTSDPRFLRTQQRVIVYPKILSGLNEFLSTGDLNQYSKGNRGILYQKIAEELQTYARPPVLLC
jgi:hypothetical protein